MSTIFNCSFTPEKVWCDYHHGKISRTEALNLIGLLIEKGEESSIRITSLKLLENFKVDGEKIFKILESCLISDEEESIRTTAANIIQKHYPELGLQPLKWVVQHDNSLLVFRTLLKLSERISDPNFILLMERKIESLSSFYGVIPRELIFLLDLQILFDKYSLTLTRRDYSLPPSNYKYSNFYYHTYYNNSVYTILNRRIVGLYLPYESGFFHEKEYELILDSLPLLTKLKFLSISKLNSIPKSLTSLRCLKGLRIKKIKYLGFPKGIINLRSLRELVLPRSFFSQVSRSLHSLITHSVAIKYIKKGVHPDDATILGLFDAYLGREMEVENRFDMYQMAYRINEEGHVVRLRFNDGENYPIPVLPRFLFSLIYLEELEIRGHFVEYIPYAIKKLKHLKVLNLSYNNIRRVSNSIALLTSLEKLILNNTNLKSIPECILQIPNLKYLDIGNEYIYDSITSEEIKKLEKKYDEFNFNY